MNIKIIASILGFLAIIGGAILFLQPSDNPAAPPSPGVKIISDLSQAAMYEGRPTGPLHSVEIPAKPADPQLAKIYDAAINSDETINKNYTDYEAYLSGGISWKSLGDLTREKVYYQLSEDLYQQALIGYGDDFHVLWLNLGYLRVLQGELAPAEEAYRLGIEKFPNKWPLYEALIELYKYQLKKPKIAIIKIYEDALNAQSGPAKEDVIFSYAPYLKEVGDYKMALHYYEQLTKIFPGEKIFKDEVEKLRVLVGK